MTLSYHEPPEELTAETRDLHRGLATLVEELEAIDWYQHRIDVTRDDGFKAILVHNRDEEMEHAAMTLEWLRRRMPELDATLRLYLFTSQPITEIEEAAEGGGEGGESPSSRGRDDLGLGKFKHSA